VKTDEEIKTESDRWAQDETISKEIVTEVEREAFYCPDNDPERANNYRTACNLKDLMTLKSVPDSVEQYEIELG
jgi:hypothetical protein